MPNYQQLYASNISPHIDEALSARVKDPLWFLARQWQTGEFEAENGGRPLEFEVISDHFQCTAVTLGSESKDVLPSDPLEAIIEEEYDKESDHGLIGGDSPAWKNNLLEYQFSYNMENPDSKESYTFNVSGYDGANLDWYHFSFKNTEQATLDIKNSTVQRMIANQLYFKGAPDPRWWKMEESDAYFDSPTDPEPNILSLLLPEFFYTDINNWYTFPLPSLSGSLRKITNIRVVDSFGFLNEIEPIKHTESDNSWGLFEIDSTGNTNKKLGGDYFFSPNIAVEILHNDELEEVRFIRDEDANLVWAWEQKIQGDTGENDLPKDDQKAQKDDSGLPHFKLKSDTERNWIPYLPRRNLKGAIHLKRGRTDETATVEKPQYQTRIVGESKSLREEVIPPTGLKVRRIKRTAVGSDGKIHSWVGREKSSGNRTQRPNLKFDYLEQ